MTRFTTLLALGAVALVGAYVLVTEKPEVYERIRYPLAYEQIIRGHARNYDLDAALLAAVIYHESRFRADARSSAGAIGLMQLRPETARGIALRTGGSRFRTADLYDPEINVRYGAWYLRHLQRKYSDDRLALAAYNAGQANVDRWRQAGRGIEFAETRRYIRQVLEARKAYARTYGL